MDTSTIFKIGVLATFFFTVGYLPEKPFSRGLAITSTLVIGFIVAQTTERSISEGMHVLLALAFFSGPTLAGALIKISKGQSFDSSRSKQHKHKLKKLNQLSELEILQVMDNHLNSVIGANNVWIQKNWTSLNDDLKIIFVKHHRKILNEELPNIWTSAGLIELLQRIERGLIK